MGEIQKKWFNTQDLMARYGVSRFTIRLWEKGGKLPRPDRVTGAPRWWGPGIEEHDRQRAESARSAV